VREGGKERERYRGREVGIKEGEEGGRCTFLDRNAPRGLKMSI
jgi:hypothetical protein